MFRSRIFGTPPEPVFNMKTACLPPELLEEALYALAAENEKSMNSANGLQGFFKGGKNAGNVTDVDFRLKKLPAIVPFEVNENRKLTFYIIRVFQNMFFSSVKKWVYRLKPAFWQLKFLTGKCLLKLSGDMNLSFLFRVLNF